MSPSEPVEPGSEARARKVWLKPGALPSDIAVVNSDDPRIKLLASPRRSGTYSREQAWEIQRALISRLRVRLSLVLVGAIAIIVAFQFLPGTDAYGRGLVTGLFAASVVGSIAWLVVMLSGTSPQLSGSLAEEWTVEALSPLVKEGQRLINGAKVKGQGDLDHVLFAPTGTYLLETKWRSGSWAEDSEDHRRAMTRLASEAHTLSLFLKTEVTPVLVLWGRAAETLKKGTGVRSNGTVQVIAGEYLERWLRGRAAGRLSEVGLIRAWGILADQVERRETHEGPRPRTFRDVVVNAQRVALAGVAGIVAPAFPLSLIDDATASFVLAGLLLVAALLVLRRATHTASAIVLTIGTAMWTTLALAALIASKG